MVWATNLQAIIYFILFIYQKKSPLLNNSHEMLITF